MGEAVTHIPPTPSQKGIISVEVLLFSCPKHVGTQN